MAWTSPATYTTGQIISAADLNLIRDNFNETAPAKVTTAGDTVYATAANTIARLAKGTARQVLQINSSTTAPEWAASPQSVLTAQGDILYASSANTLARLAKGTAGQVLKINASTTAPEWGEPSVINSVQRGQYTFSNIANNTLTTYNQAITGVVLDKSFVADVSVVGANTSYVAGRGYLTSSENIRLEGIQGSGSTGEDVQVAWEVVEFL